MHQNRAIADDYFRRVESAKRAVLQGEEIYDPLIPDSLLRSWQRSFDYGLDCADQKLTSPDYPLFIINEQDRHLSAVVGQEIDGIWDSFGGENWAVYCTNADGLIIRARHGSNPVSRAFALHVGRRIKESDIGTTAPACAFFERRPVTLMGAEHYLHEFAHLFCSAAPLWGPWGKLVGVLNITGSEEFKSRLVEKKLWTAAIKIENRLFIQTHEQVGNSIFKIHYDADFIDTHLAGLVAINAYGDILSATRNALEMLEHIDPFGQRCNVTDVFHGEFVIANAYCLKSSLSNGIVFYTKSHRANESGPLTHMAPIPESGSLRDLSVVHMLETLRSTGGNVSKAAKALGISRTTLYRALNKA